MQHRPTRPSSLPCQGEDLCLLLLSRRIDDALPAACLPGNAARAHTNRWSIPWSCGRLVSSVRGWEGKTQTRTLLFWAAPFSYMSKNDPFCQDRLGTDQQHAHRLVTRVCLLPAAGGGFVLPDSGSRLRKQLLLPLCILKMIILPRQARDKHSAKHPKQDYGLLAEIRPTGEENLAATLVYGELLLEAHSNRQGQKQQH
jgi:hypothetical protein